jgi:hypothetical protein
MISNKKLLLISIFALMASLSLQGCGAVTRVLLRASSMAQNKSNDVECLPVDEAKKYVGSNVCLTGRVVDIIDLGKLGGSLGMTGMQYWIGDNRQFVLMGDKTSFPDVKEGDCVAALSKVIDNGLKDIDGETIYWMYIDDPFFNLYSSTECQ